MVAKNFKDLILLGTEATLEAYWKQVRNSFVISFSYLSLCSLSHSGNSFLISHPFSSTTGNKERCMRKISFETLMLVLRGGWTGIFFSMPTEVLNTLLDPVMLRSVALRLLRQKLSFVVLIFSYLSLLRFHQS